MTDSVRRVNIFVASPGDVSLEREQLSKVVKEINLTISASAPEKRIILELIKWETHVHPGLGRGAQDVINQQIGDYDIFVGLMWKRFGTPTSVAGSGTEEEFQRAYATWKRNKTLPVLFYEKSHLNAPPGRAGMKNACCQRQHRSATVGHGGQASQPLCVRHSVSSGVGAEVS